jgi:hypothetical protein
MVIFLTGIMIRILGQVQSKQAIKLAPTAGLTLCRVVADRLGDAACARHHLKGLTDATRTVGV